MLRIYVDAATKGNPGPSGGGIVYITDQNHQHLHLPLGTLSNHEAEFNILLEALQLVLERQEQEQTVIVHSDSKIVVQSIEKNHVKNQQFLPYLTKFQQLEPAFSLLLIKWIPENQNKGADQLARQALQKFYPVKKNKRRS